MKKLLLLLSIFVLAAPLTKSTNDGGTIPNVVICDFYLSHRATY